MAVVETLCVDVAVAVSVLRNLKEGYSRCSVRNKLKLGIRTRDVFESKSEGEFVGV